MTKMWHGVRSCLTRQIGTTPKPIVNVRPTFGGIRATCCYGNAAVRTPNIDALAREGVKFNLMFATSPTCSPARASMLLGKASSCREEIFATHSGDGVMNVFPERATRDLRYKYILNLHPEREWTTHFTKVKGIPNSHAEVWQTWIAKAKTDAAAAHLVDMIVHHPAEELYDTRNDPYELTNLAARAEDKPVLERMRERLAQWRKKSGDQDE